MVIRIMCPNLRCRRILAVPLEARGKAVRCRNCGTMIQVPEPAPAKAPVAPVGTTESDEQDSSDTGTAESSSS